MVTKVSDYLKKGWTSRAAARDISGISVSPVDLTAVAWCFAGAAQAAFEDFPEWCFFLRAAEKITGYTAISVWNDRPERTQEEVVALAEQIEMEQSNLKIKGVAS